MHGLSLFPSLPNTLKQMGHFSSSPIARKSWAIFACRRMKNSMPKFLTSIALGFPPKYYLTVDGKDLKLAFERAKPSTTAAGSLLIDRSLLVSQSKPAAASPTPPPHLRQTSNCQFGSHYSANRHQAKCHL
jgi:hypothetical protein